MLSFYKYEERNAHIVDYINLDGCKRREENQLDATECFIAIIICSTCFAGAGDCTCVIAAFGV